MNDFQIVDMSNQKYFIIGIRLERGIQSCFYMIKNNKIGQILITDKEVNAILDGQLILSIKALPIEWLEKMLVSFLQVLNQYQIKLEKNNITVEIENKENIQIINNILEKMGLIMRSEKPTVTQEKQSKPIPNSNREIQLEEKNSRLGNNLKKENNERIISDNFSPNKIEENQIENPQEETTNSFKFQENPTLKKISTLDMDILDHKYNFPTQKKKRKLPIILLIISLLLILGSIALFLLK